MASLPVTVCGFFIIIIARPVNYDSLDMIHMDLANADVRMFSELSSSI